MRFSRDDSQFSIVLLRIPTKRSLHGHPHRQCPTRDIPRSNPHQAPSRLQCPDSTLQIWEHQRGDETTEGEEITKTPVSMLCESTIGGEALENYYPRVDTVEDPPDLWGGGVWKGCWGDGDGAVLVAWLDGSEMGKDDYRRGKRPVDRIMGKAHDDNLDTWMGSLRAEQPEQIK